MTITIKWAAAILVGALLGCSSQQESGSNSVNQLGTGGRGDTSIGGSGGRAASGGLGNVGGTAETSVTASQPTGGNMAVGGTMGQTSSGGAATGGYSFASDTGGSSASSATGGTSSLAPSGGRTNSTGGVVGSGGSLTSSGGLLGSGGLGGTSGQSLGGVGGALGGTSGQSLGGSGGLAGAGGATGTGGTFAGGTSSVGGSTASGLVMCPDLPGATKSPLYSITVNGTPVFVEQMTKFAPEMQVHYSHFSLAGTAAATIAVTVQGTFNAFKLSPKSRKIAATKSGSTVTFSSGPNYLIFQPDTKDLLFILIDSEEANPPRLGDANVKNIADYSVDDTGTTLVTSKIQSAINAASGATQNILYFPPGKYKVGELWMKSNMTMYLACGAVLYGSGSTADFNTGSGGINIEGAQHALIRMYQIKDAKILGRGVLDANGHAIRAAGLNANLLKIEQSSNITVDGIVTRDPSYWNTLIYRSDTVKIQNYKVINCRPTTGSTMYNQTDGVDFDESTNGNLYNAFLYTGDDGMATKNEEASGTVNTKSITHEHIVVYNNSVGCKIGTKSMGQSMDGVLFKDVDVVKAGRALTIEAYDTAVVQNTTFQDIRVEAADSMLINLALDQPPDWRTAANTSTIKDTYFTNVSSDVKMVVNLHGKSSSVNVNGVHFSNFTVQGKAITSQTDTDASWNINSFVSGITFQ